MRKVLLAALLVLLPGMVLHAQEFIRYYPPDGVSTAITSPGFSYASNIGSLVNGTTAQTFNIYNTYTDASNYERLALKYDTNVAVLDIQAAGTGTARNFSLRSNGVEKLKYAPSGDFLQLLAGDIGSGTFRPNSADTNDLGLVASSLFWRNVYVARSIQGGKSKALTDNTATAFVRLAVADDDYEHCEVIYTAFAEDTATDARQIRAGTVHAAILNNSGTETVAYSTGDSSVVVTAGTFTCTFDGNSGAADTIDLRATCDTSLAATTTLTFEYRLNCPSTVTVTPQ